MIRLNGVDPKRAGFLMQVIFAITRRKIGKLTGRARLVESTKIAAHHPRLLWAAGQMELGVEASRTVPHALKDLASIRTASLVGCEFCLDIGSAIGRWKGVREAQIVHLADYETHPEFSEVERVVLRYADAMTRTPAEVSDELFAELRSHLEPKAVVELTTIIAWENYRARFNDAFGLESEGFSEGGACALSTRRHPALAAPT